MHVGHNSYEFLALPHCFYCGCVSAVLIELTIFPSTLQEDEKPEFALFTPFSVKPGMTLAKPPRPSLSDTGNIDTLLQLQDPNSATYLRESRDRKLSAKSEAIVVSDAEDEVMIVSSLPVPQVPMGRYKLLQFHTNYRPAYYGTWRRRSKVITPRNPFRKDEVWIKLNYTQVPALLLAILE